MNNCNYLKHFICLDDFFNFHHPLNIYIYTNDILLCLFGFWSPFLLYIEAATLLQVRKLLKSTDSQLMGNQYMLGYLKNKKGANINDKINSRFMRNRIITSSLLFVIFVSSYIQNQGKKIDRWSVFLVWSLLYLLSSI